MQYPRFQLRSKKGGDAHGTENSLRLLTARLRACGLAYAGRMLLGGLLGLAAFAGCEKPRPDGSWSSQRLTDALNHPKVGVRERAAQLLGEREEKEAVWPLVRTLGDREWTVRHNAVRSLGQIGDRRAAVPLIRSLKDNHWWVRVGATQALAQLKDRSVMIALIAALRDENESVRAGAARSLGLLGDRRAIGPLRIALKDDMSRVRTSAVEALERMAAQ